VPSPTYDGGVCLAKYAPLLAPLHNIRTCEPGVELYLIDADHTALPFAFFRSCPFDPGLQLIEVMHAVVTHPDASDLAGLHTLDEGFPATNAVLLAAVRAMQKIEVDIFEASDLERIVDVLLSGFVAQVFGWNLRREEELFPWNSRLLYAFGRWCFVS
jgi:hypothetical protein